MTIVMLGLFLFVRATLAGLGRAALDQIEISVYLNDDVTPAQVASVRRRAADGSAGRFGRSSFRRAGSGRVAGTHDARLIDTSLLTENPLPDKFRVKRARSRKRAGGRGDVRRPARRR